MKEKRFFKSTIAFALIVVMLATGTSVFAAEDGSAETGTYYYGDANLNGEVTADDALLVLQHSAHLRNIPEGLGRTLADMNGDRILDATDALAILQTVAVLIEKRAYPGDAPAPANPYKENAEKIKNYVISNGEQDSDGMYTVTDVSMTEDGTTYVTLLMYIPEVDYLAFSAGIVDESSSTNAMIAYSIADAKLEPVNASVEFTDDPVSYEAYADADINTLHNETFLTFQAEGDNPYVNDPGYQVLCNFAMQYALQSVESYILQPELNLTLKDIGFTAWN